MRSRRAGSGSPHKLVHAATDYALWANNKARLFDVQEVLQPANQVIARDRRRDSPPAFSSTKSQLAGGRPVDQGRARPS